MDPATQTRIGWIRRVRSRSIGGGDRFGPFVIPRRITSDRISEEPLANVGTTAGAPLAVI